MATADQVQETLAATHSTTIGRAPASTMVEHIDAQRVRRMMDSDQDILIVDALKPDSFNLRHLPGAINIPQGDPHEERLVDERLPNKRSVPIIVYCADAKCEASPKLAKRLEQRYGYTRVYEFEDGLAGWNKAGEAFERPGREEPPLGASGAT